MFPSSLRFFWSLQFSTGSQWGYPRVVPPGGLSGLWGQPLQSFLLLLWCFFSSTSSSTTRLLGRAGPSFPERLKLVCTHCIQHRTKHGIVVKIIGDIGSVLPGPQSLWVFDFFHIQMDGSVHYAHSLNLKLKISFTTVDFRFSFFEQVYSYLS